MDRSAFEQKARTWREKALSVSLHYGAGEDMAEDIAQDVMLRLWQMHDELERYQSVEAIVTLMAKHTLRNHQRRRIGMAHVETTATANYPAHPTLYATGGTQKPRRDSQTIGHRNNIS